MPPESCPAGRLCKGFVCGFQKPLDSFVSFVAVVPKETSEKINILIDGKRSIEILAETLGDISNIRADIVTVGP